MERSDKLGRRIGFLIGLAYWAAILAMVFLGLKTIRLVLPLLLALAFAALARPVALFLSRETRCVRGPKGERVLVGRKLHLDPSLAGALSVLALLALLGALFALLAVRAANAAAELLTALPAFYEEQLGPGMDAFYQRLIAWSRRFDASAAQTLQAVLAGLGDSLGSAVTALSGQALGWLTSLAARLPGLLLDAVVTMIAAVFIAADYDRIRSFIRKNLPSRPLHYLMTVRHSFVGMMGRLMRSYLIILLLTAAENSLGLWLIGVRRPLLTGLFIAVVDIFPVVGSGTVLIPWAAAAALTGDTLRGGQLLLLYLAVTLARQLLEPKIVGERVGLRPIVTLGSMVVGARLFGAVGLFALPVMAAILADLNSSGVISLFQRPGQPEEEKTIIHSEGIEA